jgi:gamma-glutamyl hercynylcysteine S-oxide hydrolase
MCRHLAYLGPPASVRELLIDPPYSLYRQSWEPRRQRFGTVNADGFGLGWYVPGDPVPARYRQAGPIWADPNFAELARVTRASALLAAVRDATVGAAPGAEAAAPYRFEQWLFSHNGRLDGWPGSVGKLAETLSGEELLGLESRTDSALVWALIVRRLKDGAPIGAALQDLVAELTAATGTRLNLLVTDGSLIAATVVGDSLSYLAGGDAVTVASEPITDDPGWVDVPDGTLVLATATSVEVSPLIGKAAS